MNQKRILYFVFFCICIMGISRAHTLEKRVCKIAIIADAHLQDIEEYPKLIRSMESQVQSTRLFNENYFAFISALEDVVKQGISLVILPGDLTDDGQLINQEAMKRILNKYARLYGISFFVTTGNHDPINPHGTECTRYDFLTNTGKLTAMTSDKSLKDKGIDVDIMLHSAGYAEEMACYAQFGFFPKPEYLYWESPFSSYKYESYAYEQALAESSINNRRYVLCDSVMANDASYLVEPIKGLWLLSIDGSVYLPDGIQKGKQQYKGAGLGYKNVMKYKPFLLPWVEKIAKKAKQNGKVLIAFSHYPLIDFNKGASQLIGTYWGKDKFELSRIPEDSIAEAFHKAGIRVHIAGHMHLNNIGVKKGKNGECLYNIQVPSIVTCIPAYKILTISDINTISVSTHILDNVPEYKNLFPLYEKEYTNTLLSTKKPIWNNQILKSKNYVEYCAWHFKDLVRTRFIPSDLPNVIWERLNKTDKGALLLSELVLDLYRLRYAGELARKSITKEKLSQYKQMFNEFRNQSTSSEFIKQMTALEQIFQCFLKNDSDTLDHIVVNYR